MSKVKIDKEFFYALEKNKEKYKNNFPHEFLWDFIRGNSVECGEFLSEFIPYKDIIDVIIKGYERELTPHEKIKKKFDDSIIKSNDGSTLSIYKNGFSEGILSALEALGEKVEGVNK